MFAATAAIAFLFSLFSSFLFFTSALYTYNMAFYIDLLDHWSVVGAWNLFEIKLRFFLSFNLIIKRRMNG